MSGNRLFVALCVASLASAGVLTLAPAVAADAGSLDPSYGNSGVAVPTWPRPDQRVVKLQGDGKAVVAGATFNPAYIDFGLVRLGVDGKPDGAFGHLGVVQTDFGGDEEANDIAIQPDGRIVAVGTYQTSKTGMLVARYRADGSLDTTFSADGKVALTSAGLLGPTLERAYGVAVQPDGRVVVVGSGSKGLTLVRLTTAGALDTTFSGDGVAFSSAASAGYAVGLQSDGRIVVGGSNANGAFLVRFTSTGALDTSFAANGFRVEAGNVRPRGFHDLTIVGDKIVAPGAWPMSGGTVPTIYRYLANGARDTSFSQDGVVIWAGCCSGTAATESVLVQADGKVVGVERDSSTRVSISRYLADGAVDSAFGEQGRVLTTIKAGARSDAVLQADGKLLVNTFESTARFLMETTSSTLQACNGMSVTIAGTSADETITGTSGPDVISAGAGNDVVNGLGGNDVVCGGDGNDRLVGGDGSDRVYGESGADRLSGSAGADRLEGGTHQDTVDYGASPAAVSVNLAAWTGSGEGDDVLVGVETVLGSRYADTLVGSERADVLAGGGGDDTLKGVGGNDWLYGLAGADLIDGGDGTDVVSYGLAPAAVTVNLAQGNASGGDGADTLVGVESAVGSSYADVLTGSDLANSINGLGGGDRIAGLGGDDLLLGADGADALWGGAGIDRCDGGANPSGTSDAADATCETKVGIP